MDVAALADLVARDRAAGRAPFFIAATAGTTNAGAVDPIAEVARRERLWLHVDAAWGGAAALCPELRSLLAGIGRSDSITFDAHKWLSVPMGAGMFLTREAGILRRTFQVAGAAYMPPPHRPDCADPYAHSMQWSRRFAGLKVFLSLLVAGWDGYAAAIREQVALGRRLREAGFAVVNETELPVVCFVDARRRRRSTSPGSRSESWRRGTRGSRSRARAGARCCARASRAIGRASSRGPSRRSGRRGGRASSLLAPPPNRSRAPAVSMVMRRIARLSMLLSAALALGVAAARGEGEDVEARLARGEVVVSGSVDESAETGRGEAIALIDAPPARLLRVVSDFEAYPDFMPYVLECGVVGKEGEDPLVRTKVRVLLLTLAYTLRMHADADAGTLAWSLVEGDFRVNRGSWRFEPAGEGRSRVTYEVEVAPNVRVPKAVLRQLSQAGLEGVMKAVRAARKTRGTTTRRRRPARSRPSCADGPACLFTAPRTRASPRRRGPGRRTSRSASPPAGSSRASSPS